MLDSQPTSNLRQFAHMAGDPAAERWLMGRAVRTGSLSPKKSLGPKEIERLRQTWGAPATAWLLECAELAKKAESKWGPGPWWTTSRSLEQASDASTARYKSSRFPAGGTVVDLCCGSGGDTIFLAQRGPIYAVDADPQLTLAAAANLRRACQRSAGAETAIAVGCDTAERLLEAFRPRSPSRGGDDVADQPPPFWLHADPDRRPGGRRTTDPDLYAPPAGVLDAWIQRARGAAVKLAPAAALPDGWRGRCVREWISSRGQVRQQVAWFGDLASAWNADDTCWPADQAASSGPRAASVDSFRIATRLGPGGQADSFTGSALAIAEEAGSARKFLFDFDPAVRAAGLSAALTSSLSAATLGGPSGFATGERGPSDRFSGLVRTFRVRWSGAADRKRIKQAAAQLGVRLREIKVRGSDWRPEVVRRQLADKRTADRSDATLLVGRTGRQHYAVIAEAVRSDAQ